MPRDIDKMKQVTESLFKTYHKFSQQHFGNKTYKNGKRQIKVKEDTYYNMIGDGLSFVKKVLPKDIMETAANKKMMKAVLQTYHADILEYLKANAWNTTSASWDKRRRALEAMMKSAGLSKLSHDYLELTNPAPISERSHNTKKSRRIQKVTDEIYSQFQEELENSVETKRDLLLVIELIRLTGMRPIELVNARLLENNEEEGTVTLFIEGAKKTLKGEDLPPWKRGIDRELTIESTPYLQEALLLLGTFDAHLVQAMQQRLNRVSRKLRPDSDKHLDFYSFRYTYGSNLKKNLYPLEGGRIVSAAIMGHKNTSSISTYGHYKSGNMDAKIAKVNEAAMSEVIDNVADRFGFERGEKLDTGEAIRKRLYKRSQYEKDVQKFIKKQRELEESSSYDI